MIKKTLQNGFSLPVLGLGTWGFGGFLEPDYKHDQESITVIREAIELGYTHIDTAELYGNGHTEELVGEAIKNLDRSNIFLTTKVFKTHLHYDEVISSCLASLKRLDTDYIDLYLIHAPNNQVPLSETVKAMRYLVKNGLIKHFGVSNFTVSEIKETQKYTGRIPIVVNQVPYSLMSKDKDKKSGLSETRGEILPYCQQNDIMLIAYRPLERGLLLKDIPLIEQLARKYNKTKAQIVLNWLVSQDNVAAITKSADIQHLKENLEALNWQLDREDIEKLNRFDFAIYYKNQ